MDEAILEFYRPYIERNATYEEFAQDVNTLGGSFGDFQHIETVREQCRVSDRNFEPVCTIPLKRIWLHGRTGQQSINF